MSSRRLMFLLLQGKEENDSFGSLTQKIYDLSYHINNQLNNKILLQKGSFFMVPIYTAAA